MDTKKIMKKIKGGKGLSSIDLLTNEIEGGLITSYEYSDPTIFLPINPFFRAAKKLILFFIRVYTKAQIVFNKNVFYTMNRLYLQNLELINKVNKIEKELDNLKKNEKNRSR